MHLQKKVEFYGVSDLLICGTSCHFVANIASNIHCLKVFSSSEKYSRMRYCDKLACNVTCFKGGCLDFSYLTELRNTYITEIYMNKQYKSSIIKNYKTTKKIFFMVFP